MHPIPARHILAVAQTGLFVALMLIGQAQYDSELARREIARINDPQVKGGPGTVVGWSFPPPVPLAQEVAAGLNVPAVLVGFFLFGFIDPESIVLLTGAHAILVLILWYLIGRELDRRRDLLPPRPISGRSAFGREVIALGSIICGLFAALFLVRYTFFGPHGPDSFALSLGLWFGLAAYVLWRKLRRWRSPGSTPSELRISS
jgi:hypothetical protein